MNYRICAPFQHNKGIIQGTKHRLFRNTSNWEAYHEALAEKEKKWDCN